MKIIGNKFLYSAKCLENDCLEVLTRNFIRKFCSKKTKNIIKYAIEENNLSKSDIDEVIQLLQKKRKSAKEVTPCNCIKGQCTCGNHKE